MKILLISTYDLGRQPFGLASPAAWLVEAGHAVTCLDLAVARLDRNAVAAADLIAFYIPMHTATRIAARHVPRVRQINPDAHLCFYGLYAPLNADYLHKLGAQTILGGEFEEGLVALAERLAAKEEDARGEEGLLISLNRQAFKPPLRGNLPPLSKYAFVQTGTDNGTEGRRITGYTEATRGCKHLCRHCPVVPVYQGRFRVVQREVVLADIRAQVAAGARHITFGDPDFFNGPGHAKAIVEALHSEFPDVTYDVTIKIEHLLKHADYIPALKETGCLFITSAVEALDARTLDILQKGHTRADFIEALALCRQNGITLNPTFVTFTPWTTLTGYGELLSLVAELDLIDNIAPIQYAIRLLIPAGSYLLHLPEVEELVDDFDEQRLCYPWTHADPRVDRLFEGVMAAVENGERHKAGRREIFDHIWQIAAQAGALDVEQQAQRARFRGARPKVLPHLSEPWYC